MIRARLLKGAGAAMAGQIVNIVMQLVLVPLMITHWGIEIYGVWLVEGRVVSPPSVSRVSRLGRGQV